MGAPRSRAPRRARRDRLLRLLCHGHWGVGSDVDLVAIVESSDRPFESRSVAWDTTHLPVPAQLLVYTTREWHDVVASATRFSRVLTGEVVWILGGPPEA